MAFTGTLDKCKACDKTVYFVDLLSADGATFHKSCFKCSHCKGTLVMSNYSSMDGVLYCKPHFEQLFKESGNFSKNFQNSTKPERQNSLTKAPNKLSALFSGTQDKCAACNKTVYPLEKKELQRLSDQLVKEFIFSTPTLKKPHISLTGRGHLHPLTETFCIGMPGEEIQLPVHNMVTMEGEAFHKSCFKCAHGGCPLTHATYAALDGVLYCKHHFAQLFMEKGNYQHVLKAATNKKSAVAPVDDDDDNNNNEKPAHDDEKTDDHDQPDKEPDDDHQQS